MCCVCCRSRCPPFRHPEGISSPQRTLALARRQHSSHRSKIRELASTEGCFGRYEGCLTARGPCGMTKGAPWAKERRMRYGGWWVDRVDPRRTQQSYRFVEKPRVKCCRMMRDPGRDSIRMARESSEQFEAATVDPNRISAAHSVNQWRKRTCQNRKTNSRRKDRTTIA